MWTINSPRIVARLIRYFLKIVSHTHMCMHKDVCIPIVILILECMKFVTYSHSIGVLRVLLCSSHVPHCHSFSSPEGKTHSGSMDLAI